MTEQMSEQKQLKIKVNDTEYNVDDLSDTAKAQLQNMNFANAEIQRLKIQLAITETARNSYQSALIAELPSQ
jgi:anti-sigma regulatory factor (Ser/Thr protein kinase)